MSDIDKNAALAGALDEHGVRPTAVRLMILRAIMGRDCPVSAQELEVELETVDRSTITRGLSLFVERGVLHAIDDGSGAVKYELCRHSGGDDEHDDLHPHFHCERCGTTLCLTGCMLPRVDLPEGYEQLWVNMVVHGVCGKCRNRMA